MCECIDRFDWDDFFVRYQPLAIRFVQGRIQDSAWAEDLFQEAARAIFERFRENPSQFQGQAHMRNYLFKTLHNLAVSALREKVRKKAVSLETVESGSQSVPESPFPFVQTAPTSESVKRDNLIRKVMARLKDAERESLQLRYEEGLSFQEMAHRTGRPVSTLHSRVESALKKIRKKIGNADLKA